MYKSKDIKELLGVRNSVLARLRNQLDKGLDWKREDGGYYYTTRGLKKLSILLRDRDVNLLHFVRYVEAETKLKKDQSNSTHIFNAQVEYLMDKGYLVYEIAKRLNCEENTLLVYKSRKKQDDYGYNLIKKDIYKIGERVWQGI